MTLKLVLFPFWHIFFYCSKSYDKVYDDEDSFDWSIISYDHIENFGHYYQQARRDDEQRVEIIA